jgi:hypothetical protein
MTIHDRAKAVAFKYYESQVAEYGLEWVEGRSGFQIMVLDIAEAIHGATDALKAELKVMTGLAEARDKRASEFDALCAQLRAENTELREALERIVNEYDTGPPYNEFDWAAWRQRAVKALKWKEEK